MQIQPVFLTLSDLLKNRLFRIPEYQRSYSWARKHRQDMFEDIRRVASGEDRTHFMATIVGLQRDKRKIVTDEYAVVEVVDGQQRLTTLIVLLKAIVQKLDREITAQDRLAKELQELLVKQDDVSLILLQMNHDSKRHFANYLRLGEHPDKKDVKTLAGRSLADAMTDCEAFVDDYGDIIELVSILKNRVTFVFHLIDEEATVYTVFEVLNSRGLPVPWLDKLKSTLMGIAFEHDQGNRDEIIKELHDTWREIYTTIGLRQGLGSETLRFAATLGAQLQRSKTPGEEGAVEELVARCEQTPAKTVETSKWVLNISKAVDRFLSTGYRSRAVTGIAHARLLAVAIALRRFRKADETRLLALWEKTSFRVFGLCGKDARTKVGSYVRLAWSTLRAKLKANVVEEALLAIGNDNDEHSIKAALSNVKNANCYEGWEDELRYLMFCYEEHLADEQGQKFDNEQWARIWEASPTSSIEHIYPQSKGSQEPGGGKVFVHRLGNLLLLPPGLNSKLGDSPPPRKAEAYRKTGLLSAIEVAEVAKDHWGKTQIVDREKKLLDWIEKSWG